MYLTLGNSCLKSIGLLILELLKASTRLMHIVTLQEKSMCRIPYMFSYKTRCVPFVRLVLKVFEDLDGQMQSSAEFRGRWYLSG